MWKAEVEKKDLKETRQNDNDIGAEQVPVAMAAYRESVDEFARHATEFLQHVPALTKAREAYQRAMSESRELRTMLDKRDETLKCLMDKLEDAISNPGSSSGSDKALGFQTAASKLQANAASAG